MAQVSSGPLLHHIFEDQAAKRPRHSALECYPGAKTEYRDLNTIANRLAHYLKDEVVGSRATVALHLEKSDMLVIAVLGVLKAGMTWLPIPIDAPPARAEQILRSCDVSLVLTTGLHETRLSNMAPCVRLGEILASPRMSRYSSNNLSLAGHSDKDLCHILFTSGSTGVPKGVKIQHAAVVHNVLGLVKRFGLTDRTRTLQFAASTFDIFGLDLFMTFACGGCLIMARPSVILQDITGFIQEACVTYTQLTPSVIQLIDAPDVAHLQILASSGEALSASLADKWRNRLRFFNAYGPTETIVCSVQELSGNDVDAACIGQALAGLEVCLLAHGSLAAVPEGEIGEICVAGVQLFQGYCSMDPNLEARECVRNGKRYYRTGDRARWENHAVAGKTIRYLGRTDTQVKVHGIRTELGDVEQSIANCQEVHHCAVIMPTNGRFAGHLCAVIVPRLPLVAMEPCSEQRPQLQTEPRAEFPQLLLPSPDVLGSLQEARKSASQSLSTQVVPTNWWPVKELPLTTSGKVDRMKLRAWLEEKDTQPYASQSEITPIESSSSEEYVQVLRSLWAEVLDRPAPTISPDVSFIDVGADSLDIIQFISKARKAGYHLTYSNVYAAKTIRQLAQGQDRSTDRIGGTDDTYTPFSLVPRDRPLAPVLEHAAKACDIGVGEVVDIYPCTPYQAGLMMLDLKYPGSYICIFGWTLLPDLDIHRFRSAWGCLLAGEPVLRNRLIWDTANREFWQVESRYPGTIDMGSECFEGPMTLGHDLCRGCLQWAEDTQRWNFRLKIHHSIIDGWSLRLMLNRLKTLYYGQGADQPTALPFTRFLRYCLQQRDREEAAGEAFWQQYLLDFSPTNFPIPPSDPEHRTHATEHASIVAAVDLHDMAARLGVTRATILYGVAALVLSMHSDTEDVAPGLILAGRDAPLDGISSMLGPAFATFPFRTHVNRESTLSSYLTGIARQVLDIIPHQHYGLQRIKRCGPGAAAACHSGCLVVVQPEDEMLAGEGLWDKAHGQTSGLADSIPLSFELILSDHQVLIKCNHDPAWIQGEDVTQILDHLNNVLESMPAMDPQDTLSQARFTKEDEDEHCRMLTWARAYGAPHDHCLHDLFLSAVEAYPEYTAIDDQGTGRQYSYKHLDTLTCQLSTFLRTRSSVTPGSIVPIALEKSALAIITILSVLRAGAAYVPIDQSWPLDRVRHILRGTDAALILCSPATAEQYTDLSQELVLIDEECFGNEIGLETAPLAVPSSLALIMYTSGSTGMPKGVMLEHGALSTSLHHLAEAFALRPGTRHMQFSSLVYDVSVSDIFIPLMSGACVCVPTEDARRNRLSMTMKEMAIESAILTPSVLELLSFEDCGTLYTLMTGGEMSKKALIQRWAPNVRLLNAYGPTEASITSTLTDGQSMDSEPNDIGKSITGWHWIIRRGDTGQIYPVPMGCVGEIAIAGHSLARGYLGNDALTQASFVSVPELAGGSVSGRVYLTGDLGRYRADGTIRIVGRKDRMVKVNGIRVDPSEPEYHLRQLGGMFGSCVVDWIRDETRSVQIAVFLEVALAGGKTGGKPEDGGLIASSSADGDFLVTCRAAHAALRGLLPPRNIPTLFVPVTRIPSTNSDKINLKLLKDELQSIPNPSLLFGISRGPHHDDANGREPATPSEIALESAFRVVFGQGHRMTTAADFFHLGGDSMLAIKLVAAARDGGCEISVQQVYEHPILENLAAHAIPARRDPKAIASHGQLVISSPPIAMVPDQVRVQIAQQYHISPDDIEDLYPASPFQEGLAAVALEDEGSTPPNAPGLYSATITYAIASNVDFQLLHSALVGVVSQNPIYRTSLVPSIQGTMQIVHRNSPALTGGMNYFRWQIDHQNRWLVFDIHHAIYDAWTMEYLLEDITYNYTHPNHHRSGRAPYRRFIEYTVKLDQSLASSYWSKLLRNVPISEYPPLKPLHQARATHSIEHQIQLDTVSMRDARVTVATVMTAALALIISAYCDADEVCFGLSLSGRDDPEVVDIAGPTLSTVPVRIGIPGSHRMEDFLANTQASLLAMRRHQHYGLHNIARLPVEGIENASRFRTLLVIQHGRTQSPDKKVVQDLIADQTSMHVNYPLVVIVQHNSSSGRLVMQAEYDPECLDRVQGQRFLDQLGHIANQCTQAGRSVNEVDFITTADRASMRAWNPTRPPVTPQRLHHLFEDMVRQQPDRLAIDSCFPESFPCRQMSYRELDHHAKSLSYRIKTHTVQHARIGLCFHKNPVMIIAMLAVWKAGRAFVTLDPLTPIQRLSAILNDIGSDAIILTQPELAHLYPPSKTWVIDPSLRTLLPEVIPEAADASTSTADQVLQGFDTAYIMYTSGSSGVPKGVVVNQSAIATSLSALASVMGLDADTRMLQFAAFTFDTSLAEIFATLITGGCVCIPSDSERLHGGLADTIRRLHVSQLVLTPTIAQLIQPGEVPTVQGLMLVGEPPTRQVIDMWMTAKPTAQILNGYGPTEASVHASTNTALRSNDPYNIGHATGCSLSLTVPGQISKLAAVGAIGEIVICGPTVAEGYLDKPDLTAQAFGADLPWMLEPMRYYRTGDLARYAADGSLIYLGRKDLQAKIHGQRIELQEIEWHIGNHGTVMDCVVEVLKPDILVAFVTTEHLQTLSSSGLLAPEALPKAIPSGLRTYLSSVLPVHMVPAVYVPVGSMPKTTSGKIDRRELRKSVEPAINSYLFVASYPKQPLTTDAQRQLAELWADAMSISVDQIGAEDTISILGGDSITLMRIIAHARKRGLGLKVTKSYHQMTLKTMADSVSSNKRTTEDNTLPPAPFSLVTSEGKDDMIALAAKKCKVPSNLVSDVYPCTPLQESLMIAAVKSRGAYFDQEVFRLAPGVSVPHLVSSLQAVWARHQILRTRIFLDQTYRGFQAVVDESLQVSLLQAQDLQLFLSRDAEIFPDYGDRLSRCSLVDCGTHTCLILTRHHAVFDGWSHGLLLADIHREYAGILESQALQGLFSSFVRHVLGVQSSPAAKHHWRGLLTGLTVNPLPQVKGKTGFEANERHTMEVTKPLAKNGHSFTTVAEAAWGMLLARYTQAEDVSFGAVRSGRVSPVNGIDSIIGPTLATVPRRLRPLRDQCVSEYLGMVSTQITETIPWEHYGLQLIRKLGQGAEEACKFRSLLVVQMQTAKVRGADLLKPEKPVKAHITRGDCLIVECQPKESGNFSISITFDDRALSLDDARWMAYHFSCLMSELSAKPTKLIWELEMAGSEDIKFTRQLNSAPIRPSHTRVDELFVQRSQSWREMIAIEASDATLTYHGLDLCSSRLASKLRKLGVVSGDIVPLWMTKSSAMVVAMLAVLKTDAAYAPLATDAPPERTRSLLKRLRARHLLCTNDRVSCLDNMPVQLIACETQALMAEQPDCHDVDSVSHQSAQAWPQPGSPSTDARDAVASSHLAYVLFTSGSTGTPKGVLIDHSALATTILENGRQLKFAIQTRMLSFAAYTFDVSVMEIYLTLLHGGRLFIPNEQQRLGDLSGYINDKQVEMALLTPTVVRNLLQSPSRVPSLKTLRVGGEPLSHSILQRWSPHVRLINSYGPTETCVDACRNACITSSTDPNNIGYPIGTHLWVVEPGNRHRLAPIGCPGELLVSGPTLAQGYLNDQEKTNQAFIDGKTLVWAPPADQRFYATGDIVRQDSDGSMNFLGRVDLQMKVNGFRIEVGEVEHAVESSNGVTAAVVDKAQLDGTDTEVLIAYLTTRDGDFMKTEGPLLPPTEPINAIIREACAQAEEILLPYMRPQFYLPLKEMPLTSSGKVDRGALRRTYDECSRDQIASYRSGPVDKRATVTDVQRVLQGLWAQVLSLNPAQIGLGSDFISLGGESLAAIKLASLCREVGFELEIADILRNASLEQMASHVGMKRGNNKQTTATRSIIDQQDHASTITYDSQATSRVAKYCGLNPMDVEDMYPCTPTQESLMAVTARTPEAYIAKELFYVSSNVDIDRFRAAWQGVCQRNPILRTRICPLVNGGQFEMVQVVCTCSLDWAEVAREENAPMQVELGKPLARFRLLRSTEGLFFELSKHHAIYDGISARLIWDDFRQALSGSGNLQPRPNYRIYSHYLRSLDHEKYARFWKECLEGYQGESFPPLPSAGHTAKASSRTQCTSNTSLEWDNACRFTFGTVAKAALSVILAMRDRRSGSTRDVCFANTSSGRSAAIANLEHMAGPTITTTPFRIKLDIDQPVNQFLQQVHGQALSMLAFEQYGLSRIREVSAAAQSACSSMTLLVVQPAVLGEQTMLPPGMQRADTDGYEFVETYGLVIECVRDSGQDSMTLSASYDASLLSREEASSLLQQLRCMIIKLNHSCSDETTLRTAIWSLVENDMPRMLAWNPSVPPDPFACLHHIMEETAKCRPEALAVDAYDGSLLYGELDAAADALAATLQTMHAVQPGDLVPLCFEKSSAMIVAILGVLKAGAGFVPLDINHPPTRMEHMIREVQAQLIVTSARQAASHTFPVPTLVPGQERLCPPTRRLKRCSAKPHDIAYVTFTSGTTGKPKGVITEHGAARLSVLEHGKRYRHELHNDKLRTLQYSSYTFDASVLDIFATMAYGGCICLPSEQDRTGNLEGFMLHKQISFADLTPTVANLLKPHQLPTLKVLAIGGEMATRSVIDKWTGSQSPLEHFVNSYGPTEAAIACAAGPIAKNLPSGSVGKQVGASLWIVDETNHDQLLPISCTGELVISGPTLSRGYLNDSELTKKAFIDSSPWLARVGEKRFYKTGDIARIRVDGNVEVIGRKEDGQIKLHGLRLELGEIEAAIRACRPGTAAKNVCAAKVNLSGNPAIVAFVQLEDDAPVSVATLRRPSNAHAVWADRAEETLRERLPEYMIPRLWLPVDSWPLTASGKTDRRCLVAACEALSPASITTYQRASASVANGEGRTRGTHTEEVLADAWRQVLRKDKHTGMGPHDDFFKLGGDSLGVIMLVALLKEQHLSLTAQEIFTSRNLRSMARLIQSKAPSELGSGPSQSPLGPSEVDGSQDSSIIDSSSSGPSQMTPSTSEDGSSPGNDCVQTQTPTDLRKSLALSPERRMKRDSIDHDKIEDIFPASFMQMCFLIEGQKWCRAYYAWSFLNLDPLTSVARTQQACVNLTIRHPILRTKFRLVQRQCYQIILKKACEFRVLFHTGSPESMCNELDRDIQQPTCFDQVPTRFRLLIDTNRGQLTLAVGLSHAQYDGFCLSNILDDLGSACIQPIQHDQPGASYRRFIEHSIEVSNEEADGFWRSTLHGSRLTRVGREPMGLARPVMGQSIKRIIPFQFKRPGGHSYVVLLKAAWALVLGYASQSTDITFGNLVSGRYAAFEGVHKVVGPCLNVIPARIVIDTRSSVHELLRQIEERQIASIPYESVPADRIARQAGWASATAASPRFPTIFQYQSLPDQPLRSEETDVPRVGSSDSLYAGNAVYGGGLLQNGACWLMAWPEDNGRAAFRFTYAEEMLPTAAAECIVDVFCQTLHALNESNGEDEVASGFLKPSIDFGNLLLDHSDTASSPNETQHDAENLIVPPALVPVAESIKSFWTQILCDVSPSNESNTSPSLDIAHEDSFFDLGGDSISAAELAATCTGAGLSLTLQDVIDFPTVAQQTLLIGGQIARPDRSSPGLVFSPDYKFK
ncbi:MAG: hypothetical protein Q9169_002742 [Polycauliona sp. 2 TL-2023]